MTMKRTWSVLASTALAAGFLAVAPPAQAGTEWLQPQQISSKYGRDLNLSRTGRVAVWIRTNRTYEGATGGVRSAWYRSTKKGWTPSRPIAGTVGTTDVQLSRSGDYAFIATKTALLVSERLTTNKWQAPEKVAEGTGLALASMSETGNTVAWLDGVKIKVRTRAVDGTWRAAVEVGELPAPPQGERVFKPLSGDGSTLVWVDTTLKLVSSTHNGDGTWSAASPIAQLSPDQALNLDNLQLDYSGSRSIWSHQYEDGLFTSTRSGTTWAPQDYVTYDMVMKAALSPNGKVVAFSNEDDLLTVTQWLGDRWGKSTKLDRAADSPALALANKAVAWTPSSYTGSTVRASLLLKGKFRTPKTLGSRAMNPAVAGNGKTVAWSDTARKQLLSVKR